MGLARHKRKPPVSGSKLGHQALAWGTEHRRNLYRKLVSETVAAATLKKYQGRISQLEEFASTTKQSIFSPKMMQDFIIALYETGYQGSTAGGYKAAWQFFNLSLSNSP